MSTPKRTESAPSTHGGISRRAVLGGVAAATMLPRIATSRPRRDRDEPLGVAIVGGGVAGCYAGWRISGAGSGLGRTTIFERNERIGGRLYSVPCAGLENQVAELGGMRIADDQTPLLALVRNLGLELEPYPATQPDDLYYIRGIRTRAADMKCDQSTGFRPTDSVEGKTPGEIFKLLLKKLTGRESWTLKSFQAARESLEFRGKPLYEVPYEYAWREVLGAEGFQFFQETTGYGRPNLESLAFIEEAALSLFVENYFHVRGGYDRVPKRLAAEAKRQGVDIEFGSTLVDVRLDADGLARLTFDEAGGPTRTVRARQVVLAIPNSAYGLLDPRGALGGDNGITRANARLEGDPAVKIYSNYATQWWKPAGMETGRSITDLPVRQCFYLPDPSNGGLVLSPYASGRESYGYWKPLLEPSAPNRLDPQGMAAHAIQSQLSEMHGLEVPRAREIHYRGFDGGHDGFGWSSWAPGTRYWEVLPRARTPLPGKPIHCVGQATSVEQGWVMETLASVESVMRDAYGLARPDWWPADYPVD